MSIVYATSHDPDAIEQNECSSGLFYSFSHLRTICLQPHTAHFLRDDMCSENKASTGQLLCRKNVDRLSILMLKSHINTQNLYQRKLFLYL